VNAFFRAGSTVFGLAFVAIGVALLVVTTANGGGVLGYLLGVLFIAAGAGRLYLLRRGP
jgi:NADH:ubiquinone oxidoreductase subunit 6 (subunit J)